MQSSTSRTSMTRRSSTSFWMTPCHDGRWSNWMFWIFGPFPIICITAKTGRSLTLLRMSAATTLPSFILRVKSQIILWLQRRVSREGREQPRTPASGPEPVESAPASPEPVESAPATPESVESTQVILESVKSVQILPVWVKVSSGIPELIERVAVSPEAANHAHLSPQRCKRRAPIVQSNALLSEVPSTLVQEGPNPEVSDLLAQEGPSQLPPSSVVPEDLILMVPIPVVQEDQSQESSNPLVQEGLYQEAPGQRSRRVWVKRSLILWSRRTRLSWSCIQWFQRYTVWNQPLSRLLHQLRLCWRNLTWMISLTGAALTPLFSSQALSRPDFDHPPVLQ